MKPKANSQVVMVRFARSDEEREISSLFLEWLKFGTIDERLSEIGKAIKSKELIIAEDKRTKGLIGLIHFIIHNDPISSGRLGYITAFYVRKDFRARGIGSRLLHSVLHHFMKEGVLGAEVATSHPRAIKLYKRFGFRQHRAEIGEVLLNLNLKGKKK